MEFALNRVRLDADNSSPASRLREVFLLLDLGKELRQMNCYYCEAAVGPGGTRALRDAHCKTAREARSDTRGGRED